MSESTVTENEAAVNLPPISARVTLTCDVEVIINEPDVITRVTGQNGDEWRAQFYNLRTERGVIEHLASNCLANGCHNAKLLDGWADLPPRRGDDAADARWHRSPRRASHCAR